MQKTSRGFTTNVKALSNLVRSEYGVVRDIIPVVEEQIQNITDAFELERYMLGFTVSQSLTSAKQVRRVESTNSRVMAQNADIVESNRRLMAENASLVETNRRLMAENATLADLARETATLKTDNASLVDSSVSLMVELEKLRADMAAMQTNRDAYLIGAGVSAPVAPAALPPTSNDDDDYYDAIMERLRVSYEEKMETEYILASTSLIAPDAQPAEIRNWAPSSLASPSPLWFESVHLCADITTPLEMDATPGIVCY